MLIVRALILLLAVQSIAYAIEKEKIIFSPARTGSADPDLYFNADTKTYYLTITGGNVVPVYRSDDGLNFSRVVAFNPALIDPNYLYCNIWAPALIKRQDGKYLLTFSASRYPKNGGSCQSDNVTTFYSIAPNSNFNFSIPKLKQTNEASGYTTAGCRNGANFSNCQKTIRIDADTFIDPDNGESHFFYTWFHGGNNISSFPENDPQKITTHLSPKYAFEERINEAPDVFKRGKYYYLIFSRGFYNKSYGLSYIYATRIEDLNRNDRPVYSLYDPVLSDSSKGCDGYSGQKILEAAGHSSTIKTDKGYYIYYHLNRYTDLPNGCQKFAGRDVHRSKLHFLADGSIVPFNQVKLNWTGLGQDYVYSLDVKLKDGKVVGPCLDAGKLKDSTGLLFDGTCSDKSYQVGDIRAARICSAYKGRWKENGKCGSWKSIQAGGIYKISNPRPKTPYLVIQWNNLGSGYTYSLDAILKNGSKVAPCLKAGTLNDLTSLDFSGACYSKKINLTDIQKIGVCSSYQNKWTSGNVKCSYKTPDNNNYIKLNINFSAAK